MEEQLYTCQTCGCYFYTSDALDLGKGDVRDIFCYKESFDEYAEDLKKEKGREFRRLVIHLILIVIGIIFLSLSSLFEPNSLPFGICLSLGEFPFLIGLVWMIINIRNTIKNKGELLIVGQPVYEYEKRTKTTYLDGHEEEEVEYSSDYSMEQYGKIGHNIGVIIRHIFTVGLFGWVEYIGYCSKYRKVLDNYFRMEKIVSSLKSNAFTYSAVKLCDPKYINKNVSLSLFNESETQIIEKSFKIIKHLNVDSTLYVIVELNNEKQVIKVLPHRKALLLEDEDTINMILSYEGYEPVTNNNSGEQSTEYDAIAMLLDENNSDNIYFENERGEAVEFEQIAVIPLGKDLYAILRPTLEIEGVSPDEAFVFQIIFNQGVKLIEDEDIIDKVFDAYDKLLEQE